MATPPSVRAPPSDHVATGSGAIPSSSFVATGVNAKAHARTSPDQVAVAAARVFTAFDLISLLGLAKCLPN